MAGWGDNVSINNWLNKAWLWVKAKATAAQRSRSAAKAASTAFRVNSGTHPVFTGSVAHRWARQVVAPRCSGRVHATGFTFTFNPLVARWPDGQPTDP